MLSKCNYELYFADDTSEYKTLRRIVCYCARMYGKYILMCSVQQCWSNLWIILTQFYLGFHRWFFHLYILSLFITHNTFFWYIFYQWFNIFLKFSYSFLFFFFSFLYWLVVCHGCFVFCLRVGCCIYICMHQKLAYK